MSSRASVYGGQTGAVASEKVLYCAFLLFFLYPFFRDILPFDDLFWALSMMSGLFVCVYKFNLRMVIPLSTIFWLVLAVLALGAVVLLGPDKTVLPKRMGLFLISMLMMVALSKNLDWIQPAVLSCLILLSIHALSTVLLNVFPALYDNVIAPRVQGSSVTVIGPKAGLTSHYSYNGQLVATGLLISYALSKVNTFKNGKKGRAKFGALTLLFVAALLLTTKRTPLLICISAMAIIECLTSPRGRVGAVYKILCVSFAVCVIVVVFGNQITIISNVMNRLSALFTASTLEESTSGRTLLWDRAIQLWNDSPVFGSGWGTYRYYWVGGYQGVSSAAHNVFLQLLAEVGIFGLLVFLIPASLVFIGLTRTVLLRVKQGRSSGVGFHGFVDAALVFAFVYQIYFLVYCFVGAPLYDFESFPVYFVLSCGVWYSLYESNAYKNRVNLQSIPR